MTEPESHEKSAFVPVSFDDLRRSTRRSQTIARSTVRPEPADMMALALNDGVMKNNKMAIYLAIAVFMVATGTFYFQSALDTIDALNTSGRLTARKAVAVADKTTATAGGLAQTLAHAKEMDSKAIAIGLHGVDCLNGSLTSNKSCTK